MESEPKPRDRSVALSFAPHERFEDPRALFFRNARPEIADTHTDETETLAAAAIDAGVGMSSCENWRTRVRPESTPDASFRCSGVCS